MAFLAKKISSWTYSPSTFRGDVIMGCQLTMRLEKPMG